MAPGDREERVGGEGVRFFGGVAAGLSHELSNVLNIINEIAGLQGDIALAAAEGGDARVARVADLADRIKAQVGRGEEINRRLHGFAHSVDDPDVGFDLGRLLALLAFLEARPARLAGVTLEVRPPAPDVGLTGDPFALLLALHGVIAAAIEGAAAGDLVVVTAAPHGDGDARISIEGGGSWNVGRATEDAALRAGADAWGASIEVEAPSDRPPLVVVTLPARAAGQRSEGGAPPKEES